jgi:P-type Ca2+ transporter type 2C
MNNYHSLRTEEVIKLLNSDNQGLSKEEAKKRLKVYGLNELKKEKDKKIIKIFLNQFKNTLILLLVFAGLLSLILGEKIESIAIFIIIILNAFLGFIQEYRAEKAIEALKKISAPTARVLRNDTEQKILAKNLVPGDILILESGDIVPADSRIIEVQSLKADESSLTGESVASEKTIAPLKKSTTISDQENMLFMGSIITYGKGISIVTKTGMKTELGKIASSLQKTEETQTPLQKKFTQLAKQIGFIAISLIIIVLIAGSLQKTISFGRMLIFALALTVSTIPNSLPIIVTVSLSMGAKRLAKKNMLIKKLPAAESLGSTTIICSDKTGTITQNQMTITKVFTNNQTIKVTGTGYNPEGEFYKDGEKINPEEISLLLKIGYFCNNSKLEYKDNKYNILGDPTEGSLIVLAEKGGIEKEDLKITKELPFDSERKLMSVILKNQAYVKGAPDLLLEKCTKIIENGKIRKLTERDKQVILGTNTSFAKKALRVLALAYKDVSKIKEYSIKTVESNLVFVGLVGMIDPPRPEVKKAIQDCKQAGIEVMIITGDHAITTQAVAEEINLFKEGDLILTGDQIEKLSDKEIEKRIDNIRIIARALPIQKLRIVDILKKKGHVVAMTGDGVNDAPALKRADIGIAMGITGTDVAKEVSKAVLVDDNFATIVNAIAEGRNIYDKMIKSSKYLLSCNAGEITSVFTAIILGFPLPLLPLQLLLMNLLTDDFPALGLGFESSEEGIMNSPPRNPTAKPISKQLFISIVIFGIIMGLGTLLIFTQYESVNLKKAQTMAFTTLVFFQMFAVMSNRSMKPSLKKLNPFSNLWLLGAISFSIIIQILVIYLPQLQMIFGTTNIQGIDWIKIIGISFIGFIVMELSKFTIKTPKTQTF